MKKILLIHGPNLNHLGRRDSTHYGHATLATLETITTQAARRYGVEVIAYQSNHEGDLIDKIQSETPFCLGIIINPGALTHYSYALHDALLDTQLPTVEVHLSNISEREDWRRISVTAPACIAMIEGKRVDGYVEAVQVLLESSKIQHTSQINTEKQLKNINNEPQINLVIGYPLTHTQSPRLHNTVYESLQLNATLKALPYPTIEPLLEMIKSLPVALTAVTMPFKTQVMPYLNECSETVKTLKAVNTIIHKNGQLYGHNTDVDGIRFALRNIKIAQQKVLIIGAGGAARAAGYVMQQFEAKLFWVNRTLEKAYALAEQWGGEVIQPSHDLNAQLEALSADIIIQTTPTGMHPNIQETPLAHYPFQPHQVVFDMVYNPIHTLFIQQAKEKGAHVISGIEMFIGQGLKQIELWTGKNLLDNKNQTQSLRTLFTGEKTI